MTSEPVTLRISTPGEAAQLIPYLVGFVPEESLVVSAIQNRRVQVTARVDLADVTPGGRVEDLLERIWSRFPDADAHATVYTTGDHDPAWRLLGRCDAWLPHGCQAMVIDTDTSTWHLPDGESGPVEPAGAIAAGATYAGLQRLEHRSELAARFASPPDSDQLDQQVGNALADLPKPGQSADILARTHQLIQEHLPPAPATDADPRTPQPPPIPAEDAIRLAVLIQHPAARDLALALIDSDNAGQHLALWQQVIQASPAYGADMPLYVAGMAAWASGDGASAAIALERALAADPTPERAHPARLLEGIIDQVVPPSAWNSLRDALTADADPAVHRTLNADTPTPTPPGWPPAPPSRPARPGPTPHRPPTGPGMAI